VGNACGQGLEERADERRHNVSQQPSPERTGGEFVFPPGPGDETAWARYLEQRPDAQPAIRRGSDGLAFRVDRLRLCGNGVVPLVAAYAWRTLTARLGV